MLDITRTIMSLTGITDEAEALLLQERAEDNLRTYLNYGPEDNIRRFSSSIVEMACAVYDMEKLRERKSDTLGLRSESYAEGSVSVRKDYGNPADVGEAYQSKIDAVFLYLKPYRRGHVVTRNRNANS